VLSAFAVGEGVGEGVTEAEGKGVSQLERSSEE
jgi:hypothetical protein